MKTRAFDMKYYLLIKGKTVDNNRQLDRADLFFSPFKTITVSPSATSDELSSILNKLKSGDKLICETPYSLGRAEYDIFKNFGQLLDKNIEIVFVKARNLNSKSLISMYEISSQQKYETRNIVELFRLAFADFKRQEMDDAKYRQYAIHIAKVRGKRIGQPKGAKLTTKKSIAAKDQILALSKDFNGTLSNTDVMEKTHLSHAQND